MAAVEWSFVEDGSLSVGEQTVDLAYHPKLNTVLAVTEEPALRVLDVNSGVTLQKSTLSAQSGSNIKCNYISEVDQVFLTDGRVVGLRKDLSGVLLLESALQTAVTKADDHVVVELPHSEASQLLACMMKPQRPGQEFWEEVQNELQAGLQNCKVNSADHTYHKINKWATVVLRLPHCALRSVCKTLLTELRRSNQHVPGLSIAAGIMDRLQALYPEPNQSLGNQAVDRAQMYSEAARRETFSTWPHMNYKWALPEPMAQAGFYHQPTSAGDDRAMCFTCSVCLVCWEPTDEPWSEHERHSPNCPFVRGEPTENVPLSTTLASGPAQYHGAEGNQQIACISTSSCSHLMSTSSRHGNISIWNVAHQLKLVTNFTVDPKDPAITGKAATEESGEGKPKVIEAWTEETSQSEIKSVPPGGENAKTETGSKPIDDKEDIQQDLEKDPITKSSDREENYGSIEVICTGGAWRFPEDGPSTELKTGEDIPPIKPLVSEPPLPIQETTASTATTTTPSKDLIVSALCIVAGMESKTAPPAQSSVNPNTSQPNSPSKHIADIDNVAPPCLVAGVSLCSPKEIPPNPSDSGTQKSVVVEELTSSGGDDAGLGVDLSSRKLIYADAYLGDTVDSTSNSPVEDIAPGIPAVRQRHCLLVYRTSPKVKESASSKTVAKAKGNLYKTSAMYSLPTLAMSEILEMEEEQQALVEEPIGLEELNTEQVSSGLLVADAGTTGSSSKSSITNEKAVQCIDLPAAVQRDDLWISGIVPCLDRQHILVVVGPHDGHLQNSGTSSNVTNKCNTVQCESRNNISQQNDLNKGSAFEDDEYDEDKPQDSTPINTSFSKPFAKFFSENMPNEEASGGPSVEDIAIGESECIKPFAKFFSENPALAQNSSNTSSSDFVPQDPGDDSGSTTNPFAKLFAGNSEDLTSSGKTDSRFFPRKPQQEANNGNKSDQPFAKYLSGVVGGGGGGNGGSEKDSQQNGGCVLVYKLHCKDSMVAILEEPVYIHSMGDTCKSFTKVVPLPTEICDSGSDEESDVKPDVIAQQPEELSWEPFDEADSKETPSDPALGKFAALTNEGKVIVFDAATFNILSTVVPSSLQSPKMVDRTSSNDKFIAMMYCAGMERLCVCSSSGHITFLQLATREMTRAGKRSKRIDKIDTEQETDSREDTDAPEDETGDDYLTNTPLTQENLAMMRLLTQFETLVPRFCATVPPCWAEIQQEQQQRRHPQHLHQRQQGDATQHTRTWKLQPNGSKDHLFELVLPKACCVGHVDIKFTLHPSCPSPPKIQLTLLRQSGSQCLKIERETDAMNIKSAPVDAQINFNMDSPAAEPKEQNVDVISSEEKAGAAAAAAGVAAGAGAAAATAAATGPHFRKDFNFAEDSLMKSVFLRQHREDIVCGPCDLECFVDMPSHTGVVTLTSRELMLSKNRSFLLHICAQELPGGEAGAGGKGTDGDKGTPFLPVLQSTPSSSATERLTAGSMRKETERYQGCDWVQELSITIRRTKKVNVPRDRLQRVMMLESKIFHNNLVETVTGAVDGDSRIPTDSYTKELGLEILCWIAGVQICEPLRYTGSSNTVTLVETVQKHLQALVKTCYLDSDRSIAHKCSRLLALCIGCTMRWRNPGGYDSFRLSLLQSLLHWLPVLPCATSAGALKWFFTLLNMVKQVNPESTSQACVSLLTLVAKNLEERTLPVHSILRARFGLYGTPLDPVLFDIEPTIPVAKSGSSKPAGISTSPYHQGVMAAPAPPGVTIGSGTFGGDIDINGNQIASSKLSRDGSATSLGGAHFMRGLLEVEPLHFMCCSTSDGTYVERIGAGHENIASAIAMSAGPGNASEGYTGGPSAALASLSSAMASAEQQLQMLQHKTHALIKLHQQKHKLEQKLQETSNSNSLPSQGYTEVFPATPKNTPFFMTPPLTPPNESTIQFGQSALWDVPDMYFPGMAPYMTKYSNKGSKAAPGTPKGKGKVTDVGRSSSEAIQTNPTLVRNLLNPPQSHVLVIDRMHSGARRFAVLDFGRPILLTDIYIPSCFDLASLSVDVWNQGEEQDGRRLAVALDIGTKDLVMNDLLPPAVCRYLKLTVVGRYGGNAVRSKIPLGVFYGHTFFSSHDQTPRDGQDSDSGFSDGQQTQQEQYLNLALAVQEDIQCRYSLACNRLERLLSNVDIQTGPAAFMRSEKMDGTSDIHKAYQECMQLQQQLNVVQRTIGRLQQSIAPSVTQTVSTCTSVQAVRQASSDELRVFCEYLLDTMLGVTKSADPLPVNLHKALNMDTCKALFKHLCVMGTPQLRLRTGTLLVRVCSSQYWWGEFLASSLNEFFNSDQTLVFPQDRVFLLLASLGQKSLIANNSVLEHLLTLLARLLSPLLNGQVPSGFSASTGPLDLSLVGWVLLFLSRTLDHTVGTPTTSATATATGTTEGEEPEENGASGGAAAAAGSSSKSNSNVTTDKDKGGTICSSRWDFMTSNGQTLGGHHTSGGIVNRGHLQSRIQSKLKKQLQLHKEQLTQLQSMHKAIQAKAVEEGKDNDPMVQVQIKKKLQQHASKHLRDILRIRRITERNLRARGFLAQPTVSQDKPADSPLPEVQLPRQNCIPVLQGLMNLLLAMDFTCHVDLFLVTCKVLARIANATRPAITLSEIASSDQLTRLLLLCVSSEHNQGMSSWGGPWASHAITCLLQDILEGERLYPFSDDFHISDSSISVTEDTSDLDSDLTPDAIPDDVEAAGGANGSDESESNGGDIFSEGAGPTEQTYMSPVPEPDVEFIGTPLDPYDAQYMDHVIFGSSKYDDFDWPEKSHPMKVACKFGATQSPFGSSHKNRAKYRGSPPPTGDTLKGGGSLLPSVSMAMDARLEQGLELQVEWYLKVTSLMDAHSVGETFSGPLCVPPATAHLPPQPGDLPPTDDALAANMASGRRQVEPSTSMLSKCFNQLFGQLQYHRVQLDSLLQLWLQVLETNPEVEKQDNSFDATVVPSIPLNQSSLNKLLAALAWQLNIPVHTWCLAFHALSAVANSKEDSIGVGMDIPSMANIIVMDTNLLPALVHFLSGSALHGTAGSQHYSQVGPTVTQALYEFLSRLQIKLASSQTPNTLALKELLLRLVHILSEPSGAFHTGTGPLDAQVRFLDFVVEQAFGRTEINSIVSMIDSISLLVHNHITRTQRVAQYTNSDTNVNARSCFGGLFASMLRPGDVRSSGGEASRDVLMCSLLQLVNQLIKVPLDDDSATRFLQELPRQEISLVGADLGSLPVTDSSKLNASMQQSIASVGSGGPMSDDDKERSSEASAQSATPAAAAAAPAEPQQVPKVCDIVLSNKETLSLLLSALNHCSSNTMASIIGSSTLYPSASDSFANVDPLSVGDNIFQILCTLGNKAHSVELMLRPLLSYLSTNQGKTGCSLSEPLLWFILKILGEQKSLQSFHDMGGVRIVCTNLVVSNRAVIDTSPSTVSAIMQHLGSMAKPANNASTSSSRSSRTVAGASAEVENVDGLVNFAPYGSINSSSATAQPAEVLLQPTPPHRRARSAAWSYHFYPDEAWCDLHITLPNAILLREVHIQPHLTSLATCPSSVSLEISADGSTTVPICPPLPTSGLTYVKLQLPRPEITTSVCLRLHRPRDSNTIGLSQIMLLGVTAFGNISNGSHSGLLWSSDDNAAKSSIRWLRLLHHCLTQVPQLEVQIANTASRMPALLTTCSSLLLSPHCQVYAANIEAVMLKLGLCCTDVGLTMFDLLLRSNYSSGEEEHAPPMLGHSAGVSSHSTVDIIFQLGTSQDTGTKERVQALLDWLGDTARVALRKHSHFHRAPHTLSPAEAGLLNPAPAHVHCVATIIWASHQQANSYSVASLLTNELFSSVYEWSMVLPLNSTLKRAADFVLCAMCYVQPALFESLLQWMGISLESGLDLETSLTDDNKDAQEHAVRHSEDNIAGLTDDTKGAAAIHQQTSPVIDGYVQFPMEEFAHVMLDEAHLSTLAVVCQSETSTDRILGSGFPAILAQALAEFCSQEIIRNQSSGQLASPGLTDASKIKARSPRSPRGVGPRRSSSESNISEPVVSLTADLIAPVLDFFTELCSQLRMKNWLGSSEGSVFWTPLLTLLCNISANHVQSPLLASPRKQQVLTSSQRSAVESATITFFSKCITCHQTNQKLLAQVICDVTCSRGSQAGIRFAISGFTRRLILQLMLEDEKLTVFLKATFRLYKSQQGVVSQLEHPQFGTGHNYKVVEAKLASTCGQLVAQVSDTSSSSLVSDKPKTGKEESGKSSSHASGASLSSKSTFSIYSKEPNLLSSKDEIEQELYGNYSTGSLATTNQTSGPESPYKMKPKKVAVFDKETNNTSPQLPPHPQKHTAPATSKLFVSMQSIDNKEGALQVPRVHLMHELLSAKGLPDNVTLAQLVGVLQQKGMPSGFPMVQFGLNIRKEELDASKTDSSKSAEAEEAASVSATKSPDTNSAEDVATFKSLLDAPPIPSFLHIFASLGGLALIAEHLPIVYHDVPRQSGAEESRRDRQSDKWADNVNMAWQLSQAASETWAPMEPVVEEMEQVYEPPSGGSSMVPSASAASSSPVSSAAAIPPHSLGAFGLFLRLPGYAEVLLKEHKKAQFLLRLVLGVTDDGDGGHILTSPQASSLPTLPFTVLVTLFDSTPLTTDDGVLLRRMTLEIGAVHLILACLAVLSHHGPRVSNGTTSTIQELPGPPTQPTGMAQAPTTGGEKGSQSYWAKGTGFGTGSTSSGWNVEQALIRQKAEEEHVTCLLKVLSSYINPSGTAWDNVIASGGAAAAAASAGIDREPDDNMDQLQNIFPAVFVELLSQSCLIPAISSYLRNDSVLDMARHVPLYCALLEILRALACCPMLASLLLPQNGDDQISGSETSVVSLLENMKSCVDTYTSRLKFNIEGKPSSSHRALREDSLSGEDTEAETQLGASVRQTVKERIRKRLNKEGKPNSRRALGKDTTPEEDADAEGLTQLVPEIQRTVEIVTRATSKLIAASRDEMDREDSDGSASLSSSTKVSMEEHYVKIMKKMQFDTYRMITEEDDGKINFVMNHHYASNVKSSGNVTNASRARRLAQEAVTLSNSLPLSASSSVFVRCDEDRLDVMKVLITGPGETPYANGCFEFDVYFPADYPVSPMLVNLETTGQHSVRFNPNLYNDGKVCLSVLNTWHGRPEEKWNAQTSSFLQVLVSIQSLILVSEPYFNEPGYERSRGTPSGTQSSREYDANIMQATVKWAMLEMLRNPPACFKEVIQTHFYMKRTEVMAQCEEWISQLAQLCNDKRVGRSVAHHWAALKRHTAQLREELTKLKPTKILQEESNKALQEKATAPAEAASAAAAAAAASTPTNQESSPPVAENGTSHDKPSTDPNPAASGTDPLGVGAVESLHNGGDDEAGLF